MATAMATAIDINLSPKIYYAKGMHPGREYLVSVFQVLQTLGLSGSLVPGSLDSGSKFVGLRR